MYLSRFGVKNYKCLGEIDVPLTPIHVLIGENDAGKTSLLEAMAAFFASSEKELSQVFPGPWAGRELVNHSSLQASIEFFGTWENLADERAEESESPFRYGFAVDFPGDFARCGCRDEEIEIRGERRTITGHTPCSRYTVPAARKEGHSLPVNVPSAHVFAITSVLKPAHKYAFEAKLMAIPAMIDPIRKFRLDSDGFGLTTLLDDILGYDPERFIHLREEFCSYFQQFKTVRVESEAALRRNYQATCFNTTGAGDGKGIFFETQGGKTVRAQQASDGAILFLGFLALAHLPDPPNLLLIEEPENGIYPKRLGEVIALLKELVHRTEGVRFPQIILSTHSPYVLSFFEPEEVTFLSRPPDRPDGPVRARPLRDAPNIRERMGDEFYLGELWYNLSEEELFGEP